jgi:hypothetical protein
MPSEFEARSSLVDRCACAGNSKLHATIRAKTVAEMRLNADQWQHYLTGDGPLEQRYKEYCDRMDNVGCYVEGNLEIFAASTANNVDIYVIGIDAQHDRHFAPAFRTPDCQTRSATVVHYDAPGQQCHYRACERAPTSTGV